ncbi:unnamed protein product [Caenorhabditis angaria]|uniref:Uncharacterized protein n=1 Tax=Caenorhabditis angaria TaxID=860376 RepID=A0A9P1J567_9PELO|nr:unnamed protein product [Caenorhabditis angaria]
MDDLVQRIKTMKIEFEKEQEWGRYVEGDILHNVIDEKSANNILSYVSDSENELSLEETLRYFDIVMNGLSNLCSDKICQCQAEWLKKADLVEDILSKARKTILDRWTNLVFKKCGGELNKNEAVHQLENFTLSFWRASSERKGKIIFFPNIHIEIVPFLQSIRIFQHYERKTDELQSILQKYPIEFLYENEIRDDHEGDDEEVFENNLKEEIKQKTIRKRKKRNDKKGLTNTMELALKTGSKKKTKNNQKRVFSSTKTDQHIKLTLYSDVSPLWKKSATKQRQTDGDEHKVDFNTESHLGPVYHISSYESGKNTQKYGSWNITLERHIEERKLNGESIQISLKVPVEEVFLGSNEPVIAFRDENSEDWKKGVFTTHTQFDQNTFIVTTRLSKMGYVALFQHSDFHYPYKKWHIEFGEETISVKLHTNIVELNFLIEGNYFYLDTMAGDEFSKLRNLHQKKMSLATMMMKMEKHGVHIIPSDQTIDKHRDTKKELPLEIYAYRLICLNQINCESCRMNCTVSCDTIVLTIGGSPKNISTRSPGNFIANFGDAGKKRNIHKNILSVASLFQFLMVTRPIVVTK